MKNSLRIHKWTHNEFNIFILGVLTHPRFFLSPNMKGSRRKGARWHNVCTTKNIFHNQQRQKTRFIHGQNTRPFIRRRAPVVWRPRRKAGEHNRDRLIISTILNAIGLRVEVERMLSTGRIDIVAETQTTIYVIELKLSNNVVVVLHFTTYHKMNNNWYLCILN